MTKQINVAEGITDTTVSCPGGKSVLAGGYNLGGSNQDFGVFDSRPVSASDWRIRIRDTTGATGG